MCLFCKFGIFNTSYCYKVETSGPNAERLGFFLPELFGTTVIDSRSEAVWHSLGGSFPSLKGC